MTADTFCFPSAEQAGEVSARLVLRRREFLKGLAAAAGMLLSSAPLAGTTHFRDSTPATLTDALRDSAWPTLAAVQAHLFPSEAQAPGAKEINATAYLRDALDAPDADPEEKKFLFAGAEWLRGKSAREYDGKQFGELTEVEREQLLRHMASGKDGRNWASLLLFYILEALLSDPVYGGNPDAIGWKWLDYTPGFPRPSEEERYFTLLDR
ncbi:MAG: gluconate 2-dehydrogenase subunit 3 family protein [Chromatiales bacterium]